jgi:hypothetical protein
MFLLFFLCVVVVGTNNGVATGIKINNIVKLNTFFHFVFS